MRLYHVPTADWQRRDADAQHTCVSEFETVTRCPHCWLADSHWMHAGFLVGTQRCVHVRRICRGCGMNWLQSCGFALGTRVRRLAS